MRLFLLFLLLPILSFQSNEVSSIDKQYTLLVRLKTSRNQIRAAEAMGNKDHAKEIRLKTWGSNMGIMRGFKKYWGDNVYFFYSSDYSKVKAKNFDGIFLDENLVIDSTINPTIKNFFISYWGNSPNSGMNVITLLDSSFNETGIWVRTFGITPQNIDKIVGQVAKFKAKVDKKL